jgi:DNA gyrase/topoisomerase IV subunit A
MKDCKNIIMVDLEKRCPENIHLKKMLLLFLDARDEIGAISS